MYVCICNGITDKQIKREVARGADSLGELRDRLGVASQCGSCSSFAMELIDEIQSRQNFDSGLFYSAA